MLSPDEVLSAGEREIVLCTKNTRFWELYNGKMVLMALRAGAA